MFCIIFLIRPVELCNAQQLDNYLLNNPQIQYKKFVECLDYYCIL